MLNPSLHLPSIPKLLVIMMISDITLLILHLLFSSYPSTGQLFNLNQEGNLATWFASFKLTLAALAGYYCYHLEKHQERQRTLNRQLPAWLWLVVALLMLLMSMDETAQIHETFSAWFMDSLSGARLRVAFQIQASGGALLWGVLFAPLLILIATGLLTFYFQRFHQHKTAIRMAIAVVFLLAMSLFLEQQQAHIAGQSGYITIDLIERYQNLSTLEEMCELFAINFLLLIHLAYIQSYPTLANHHPSHGK